MTEQDLTRVISAVQWVLGGFAVVAAFLLVQSDVEVTPLLKVVLGAFLAFAAYANPATVARSLTSKTGGG